MQRWRVIWMIPNNFITKWSQCVPWIYQSQIEQDLVLSRALVLLFQQPIIRASLAFRGGTALNKLYCDSLARYSEDIDLVQITDEPIGEVMSAIRKAVDPWLGKASWKQTARSVKFIYRFDSEDSQPIPLRLKIEINTVEPFAVFGFQEKHYQVENPWFSGGASIRTYELEELIGTKFRALYQRSKGRDLYDLWMAISKLNVDCNKVLEAFSYYNTKHNIKISRAEYEKNLFGKMSSVDFLSDAKQVLPQAATWSPEQAFEVVLNHLVKELPGEPWKVMAEAFYE
jgi:predicted nucleotidyltransferase component of viral defense system